MLFGLGPRKVLSELGRPVWNSSIPLLRTGGGFRPWWMQRSSAKWMLTVWIDTQWSMWEHFIILIIRVWQKSQALTPQGMPLLDCSVEVDFKKPETSTHLSKLRVEFPDLEKWTLPRGPASQFGDEYYLGQWNHLFAKPSDEPIPSWDALLWLGKDHPIDIAPPTGLLANRRFRENHLFSLTPPSQVIIDSRFCGLIHRRYP